MAKHKILLTRVLTQTIELDVELPNEQDCTDGIILSAAVKESESYFDSDWRTLTIGYAYELIEQKQNVDPIAAAIIRQFGPFNWRKLSSAGKSVLRRDIQDIMHHEMISDPATAVRVLYLRIDGAQNLFSYIATLLAGDGRSIPLPEILG